jgi:hypothetical protein
MNKDSDIVTFVKKAKQHLKPLLNESGQVLYSSVTTLKRGSIYILGLNPGGSPRDFQNKTETIGYSLKNLARRDWNAYADEVWKRPALQKRIPARASAKYYCASSFIPDP